MPYESNVFFYDPIKRTEVGGFYVFPSGKDPQYSVVEIYELLDTVLHAIEKEDFFIFKCRSSRDRELQPEGGPLPRDSKESLVTGDYVLQGIDGPLELEHNRLEPRDVTDNILSNDIFKCAALACNNVKAMDWFLEERVTINCERMTLIQLDPVLHSYKIHGLSFTGYTRPISESTSDLIKYHHKHSVMNCVHWRGCTDSSEVDGLDDDTELAAAD